MNVVQCINDMNRAQKILCCLNTELLCTLRQTILLLTLCLLIPVAKRTAVQIISRQKGNIFSEL